MTGTTPAGRGEADRCSAPFRVRFDEAGPDGRLRTSVVLRYAQDLAWYHSSRRGYTRDWYAERGLTWLARAAEVRLLGPIRVGDELVGTTRVVGWRRVWARRRTEFVDAAGTPVAWTHVDWVLLDRRGAPIRIPAEFDATFGAPAADFGLGRVALPEVPSDAHHARWTVRPQELDPMDHANNAVYADWVEEQVVAAGGQGTTRGLRRTLRLEYARAAERGATVDGSTWLDADGTWWCAIAGDDGTQLLRASLGAG